MPELGEKRIWKGYVLIYVGKGHPLATLTAYVGWAKEHRLVMQRKLDRPLLQTELVHHKDGNVQNNAPENLEVVDRSTHNLIHFPNGFINASPEKKRLIIEKRKTHYAKRRNALYEKLNQDLISCACGCGVLITRYSLRNPHYERRYIKGHYKMRKEELTAEQKAKISEMSKQVKRCRDKTGRFTSNRIHRDIASKIRQLRQRLGLSQREFSHRLGIPKRILLRMEKGSLCPTPELIHAMNELFLKK